MKKNLSCKIIDSISSVIVGKTEVIKLLLITLIGEGHALIEDVPGIGKTKLAKSLALSIGGVFKRVQCTPDLLPTDITGFNIYNKELDKFILQHGPIFANVLLVDEINRAVPRTQSSLLESMEEIQVTIDNETHLLSKPFFVIATQNPIEFSGTFPLPEAELDRFLLRIKIGYPDKNEEIEILNRFQEDEPLSKVTSVADLEEIVKLQLLRRKVIVSEEIKEYISEIAKRTRMHSSLTLGMSPRASLALMKASQAKAMLEDREYVLPDDIKSLLIPVVSHRLIIKNEEETRGVSIENILKEILSETKVPIKLK
jgi:MoxR-like ATPase